MNKMICLTNEEASHCKRGKELVLVRLLASQPPEGYEFDFYEDDTAVFREEQEVVPYLIDLPYILKQRIALREPWAVYNYLGGTKVVYKSDINNRHDGHWQSSATIPADAIRHWFIPEKFEVKRVQAIDITEIYDMGIKFSFIYRTRATGTTSVQRHELLVVEALSKLKAYWNTHYAKPVKRNGERVCYPWDEDFIKQLLDMGCHYCGSVDIPNKDDGKWMYKRKQLTIHANAYVLVMEGRVE